MAIDIMGALRTTTERIKLWTEEKLDNVGMSLEVVDDKLYLKNNNGIIEESGVTLPAGSGDGTGTGTYVISLNNSLASRIFTVTEGSEVILKFKYSSVDSDGYNDGDGVGRITINGIVQPIFSVPQNKDNEFNVGDYLAVGENSIEVRVENSDGRQKTLKYTITVVSTTITSKFDVSSPFSSDINFTYVANGAHIDKNVHFELDGVIIDTVVVSTSNREATYTIPAQRHGAHILRVWFDFVMNGSTVNSNVLYFEFISVEPGNTTPIIASNFQSVTVNQYDTIVVPYRVYDPSNLNASITQYVDNVNTAELTVGRTEQVWSYRANESGKHVLKITCGAVFKTFEITVEAVEIDVKAETNNLALHLSSYGRSNNESNPATWKYNDIEAEFTNFNFISDGWQLDEDGVTVLRVSGNARLEIPMYIFNTDLRVTGKTIEIEFASRDVLNYEAVIISCISDGRGLEITSQMAQLFSEQSSIGTQYKEAEHIRISFVIEKRNDNRFILAYVNGILSGAAIYPDGDNFTQVVPASISIGSNECTTDLYSIRVYDNNLTRYQILDNWIADTQNGALMIDRYNRNQIYNDYGEITINKLPADLPYLVIEAEVLPQSKGDKKTCSGYYVDKLNPKRNFQFTGAQIDVQGTSSQYYRVKNYKIKYKNGFIVGNETVDDYQLNDKAIPTSTFTFKADVASSEGANNVVLAQLYNDLCPVKTPPQLVDDRVRQTIDGHPIVIFWNNNGTIKFLGKYNFNNDKGTEEVFGFKDGDESWEIRQNGTDRVGWRSDDYESVNSKGEFEWLSDFEARFPEDNMNTTNLKALATWLKSTNTDAATNAALSSPVVYNGVTYNNDSAEYRLAKFRAELHEHADVEDMIFYYLFTEIFLCIDQREKNAFPTLFMEDGKWIMFFYDADSSLGIDNKGKLAFSYELEDIDYTEGGDPIFNGQASVLWVNLRKAFYKEIQEMYQQLRTDLRNDGTGDRLISYDVVNNLYESHQNKWCEAIFNEDMWKKCLEPYVDSSDSQYIAMLQGKKEMQRKWWLYNRFRYLDSKYITGNSMNIRLMIRAKGKANVKLTSYVNMYGHVYYNSEMVEHRMERGKEYEFVWAASGAEDAVVGINDADMLTSLGDLAPLQVETIDISNATHLTSLKLGDGASTYKNTALTSATFGNNGLLRSLDLRNCVSLNKTLDVTGCSNIEEVYCEGSTITGIDLPNGGILKTLHLPNTVTSLSVLNHDKLTDFSMEGYENLTTMRVETCSGVPVADIINNAPNLNRIRLIDAEWEVDSEDALVEVIEKLKLCIGMDENNLNTPKPVVTGRVRVGTPVSDEVIGDIYNNFPDLIVDDGSAKIYIVNYKDWDGSILHSVRLADGEDAYDPIVNGIIEEPYRAPDDNYSYEFIGWNSIPKDVHRHYVVAAQYNTKVAVNFAVDGNIIHSEYVIYGAHAEDPVANGTIDPPVKEGTYDLQYVFDRWDGELSNVTLPRTLNAIFANVYPVRFYATETSDAPHYVQWVKDGNNASDPVAAGDCLPPDDIVTDDKYKYVFSNWDNIPTNVSAICNVYAEYDTYWAARFWNDNVLYLVQWVKDGNNVMQPEDYFGDYVDPTRESTAQYNFTFNSWDGDFTAMYEERDFSALYYEILRRYSVYFYNEEELIYTVDNVPYGSSAAYSGPTPIKSGVENPDEYVFKGWMPSPEGITGETKCSALFKFTGYLFGKLGKTDEEDYGYGTVDNPNWDTINGHWANINTDVLVYKSGSMSEEDFFIKYPIGGRMLIPISQITWSDGTVVNDITVDVEIIGHNHDNLADDSGKSPLTFFCLDLPHIQYCINLDHTSDGGYEQSDIRAFLNGDLFMSLPDELQNIIKPVYKISDGGFKNKVLVTTVDQCWLVSYDEICTDERKGNLTGQGEIYSSVFSNNNSRRKYLIDSTEYERWWVRSFNYNSNTGTLWQRVQTTGNFYDNETNQLLYIAFGFCI